MKTEAITKTGLLLPFGNVPARPTCYVVSAAAVAVAYLVRLALDPLLGDNQPYVVFCAAIAIAGWYGRIGAMLLATTLGLLIGNYCFVEPRYAVVFDRHDLAIASGYLFVAALIMVVTRAMHSSAQKAAETARKLREAEKEFRVHFELAPIGAVQCTPEGRFLRVNPIYCAITGYSWAELSSMTFYDITHPEDRASNAELVEQLMTGRRQEFFIEKRYVRKDRAIVWLEVAVSLLRDERGQPERMLAFVQDVTERKNAEQALREALEFQKLITETSKDFAIFSTDPDGTITSWSSGAERVFGFSQREVVGSNFDLLYTPEDRATGASKQELKDTAEGGCALDERWHLRKDGSRFFATGAMRPIRDDKGHLHGYAKIARDITPRKQMEDQLRATSEELDRKVQERTARLQETIAELEAFSYSLSHDLRAPLRAMEGFSQLLIADFGERLGPTGGEYLERISRAAQRMDSLIQDVLTYHSLVRQDMKLETVNIEQLLAQIVAEQPQFQPPQSVIEIAHPLLKVKGHNASLTQCIFNLLGNAVKFVPSGTQARVRVWTEPRGSRVRLWFEDNGIGIAPEDQDRIFGMFQRLHASHEYPGTGIGLAIVRKAAERMGGQVGVESQPGKGSRFWLELDHAR